MIFQLPTIQNNTYTERDNNSNMKMNDNDKDNYQAVTTVCDNITQKVISTITSKQANKQTKAERERGKNDRKIIVHTGDRHMHTVSDTLAVHSRSPTPAPPRSTRSPLRLLCLRYEREIYRKRYI